MLTDEVGNLGNPAETGTDALVFVECHVDTLTRTADGDTGENLTLLDTLCQCVAKITVVARLLVVGAVVLYW